MESDYELRGAQKHLKITAFPSVLLEKNVKICHVDSEHNYAKRRRRETGMTSQSSTYVSDMRSGATQTSMESNTELPNKSMASVSEVSDCEMVVCQPADYELIDSVICSSVSNEPMSLIDLSENQVEISNITNISSHTVKIKHKARFKKIHRGIQCQRKKEVKPKKIQVCIPRSSVSVAIQCSLVELPELSVIPRLQTSMFDFLNIEKSQEDILHSSFAENLTTKANIELDHFKQCEVPTIHHDPNLDLLGLSPIRSTLPEPVPFDDNEISDFGILCSPP